MLYGLLLESLPSLQHDGLFILKVDHNMDSTELDWPTYRYAFK